MIIILAEKFYKKNIESESIKKNKLDKHIAFISLSRLLLVIACILIDYLYYKENHYKGMIISTMLCLIIFLVLVFYHSKLLELKKRGELFINANEVGLKRINGEFKSFEDDGKEFLDEKHEYINDLDIFGKNSLFQYINSTVTKGGRELLASTLSLKKGTNVLEIKEKQEGIKELSNKSVFRQKMYVEGLMKNAQNVDLNEFIEWTKTKSDFSIIRCLVSLIFIAITVICVYLSTIVILPESFIILNLLVNFCAVKILCSGLKKELNMCVNIKGSIHTYGEILNLIEDESFKSPYIKKIHEKIKNKNVSCKKEIKSLSNIIEWVGNSKNNAYYLILNIIFFCDVFLMFRLYKWRKDNSPYVEEWVSVVNEIDALNSIANIAFENETWAYPSVLEGKIVEGTEIGHPLIYKKAVKNNFTLNKKQSVALITGSNMSGKSTFLRTIGINIILSYIGSPVCAKDFSCGVMKIYTCMRTKDNLEENISSFYAEILRIKILIEGCKNNEKVFFLLDEIFKGTNSVDRHTGASILIKQLLSYKASGLLSTHDLELCDLETKDNSDVINYNFREYYSENKIKFDYKLRRGKSETRNAIH